MLIFSQAKITIKNPNRIKVEGKLVRHEVKIRHFLEDLKLSNVAIKYCRGRYIFSGKFDKIMQQKLRNFLINDCPIKQ